MSNSRLKTDAEVLREIETALSKARWQRVLSEYNEMLRQKHARQAKACVVEMLNNRNVVYHCRAFDKNGLLVSPIL